MLTNCQRAASGNIVGKEENISNQHFLFLPKCILTLRSHKAEFQPYMNHHVQVLSIWMTQKFCLTHYHKILDWSKLKQIADHILKCIQNEK